MEKAITHCREYLVRHHECGANGKVKLSSLFDCFQDIAAEHAEKLDCGMEQLLDSGRLWVLSRLKMRILRRPRLKERLLLTTYPSGFDRLFAYRQYRISAGEEELVQGSSAWLILDGATYRPLPVREQLRGALPENPDVTRYFPTLPKLSGAPDAGGREYTVGAADIDLNCHLNNAVYARYIEDELELLCAGKPPEIAELQINFQRAGQLHDRIKCSGSAAGTDFTVSGGEFFNAAGVFRKVPLNTPAGTPSGDITA